MFVHFTNPTARISTAATLLLLCLSLITVPATAQDSSSNSDAVLTDFLNVYTTATDKTAQLAGAIPEEKFDWRPAEGIRSVKESVLHVASGNYFFGSMIGAEIPEGIDPQAIEQTEMSKEEAIATLNESVTFITDFIPTMTEEQLNTKIEFFGDEMTQRQVMLILGDHAAEHLGQLIAYARMNEVVPPWSQ